MSSPTSPEQAGERIEMALRPMAEAKKNRVPVLLRLKNPIPQLGRDDLRRWDGLTFVGRHPGLADDGFDMGWQFAAPVGHGGFPDDWFEGWAPLSALTPSPADDVAGLAGKDIGVLLDAYRDAIVRNRQGEVDPGVVLTAWGNVASAYNGLTRQLADRNAEVERLRKLVEVPADLRALSERATPGEWRVESDTTLVWGDCRVDDDGYVERMGVPVVDAQQARGWSKDGQPDYARSQCNAALTAIAVNRLFAQIDAIPAQTVDGGASDHG